MIYIEDVEPHFWEKHNRLSCERILFSLLSCYWLLELRRYTWKDYLGMHMVFLSLEGVTTRV
jgi:hypothetical protein